MKLEIGDIVRDDEGTNWVVIKRDRYEASAHNDRWVDYVTVFQKISRAGRVTKITSRTTTDDRIRAFDIVGKAEVTFTVDINKINMEK
jgi:hypothetical protein